MARKDREESRYSVEGVTREAWNRIGELFWHHFRIAIKGTCGESDGSLKIAWRYVPEAELAMFRLIAIPGGRSWGQTLYDLDVLIGRALGGADTAKRPLQFQNGKNANKAP